MTSSTVDTIDSRIDLQDDDLQEIVHRIVEAAAPDQVILSGSAARGEMSPGSDLDLVVVKNGAHRRKLAQAIYRRLVGAGQAVDIVLVWPEDLERYASSVGMVIPLAREEGITAYAA